MKKHSRTISILLAIMMVMTSLSLVFAVDELTAEPQADDQAVVTEETAPEVGETAPEAGETIPEAEETAAETDETVEDLTTEQKDAGKKSLIDDMVHDLQKPVISVTVKYVYKSGGEAAPSVTQEIELKENAKGVYEGKYSIKSPTVVGYAADKEVVEGTVNKDSENPITVKVTYSPAEAQPVKNLKLHPSNESIVLSWDRVPDAKAYVIQRSIDNSKFTDLATVKNTTAKEILYTDKTANGKTGKFKVERVYYYRVRSVSYTDIKSDKPAAASGTCVRRMYETVKFKKNAGTRLYAHDGSNQSHYFADGDTILAQGFNGGKYEFYYNGAFYTVSNERVHNCTADFQANSIRKSTSYSGVWARQNYASAAGVTDNYNGLRFYDKISAESFVNSQGRASKTKYLIWVSTYTQHVYLFQGSKGKWKLINDWECSTGAAKSPTPTGKNKQLERYVRYRHGVNWWRPFQTWNSIHGKLSSWEMGGPASNGCVRNFDPNAKLIYDKCPNGTALIVW